MKLHLTNARIVLPDEVLDNGDLVISNGLIDAICPNGATKAETIDLRGQTLMPGMIDLHCDALEKEVEPRPNVHLPLGFACAQADKRNAAAGITTAFHALSFANDELGVRNNKIAAEIVEAMHSWRCNSLIDNRIHCRYEITDETAMPILIDLLKRGRAHMASIMDHTPGQGQFKNIAAYRDYLTRTYCKSNDEIDTIIDQKIQAAASTGERIESLAVAAHAAGVSMASHDDDTHERIEMVRRLGADISEFPISVDAAKFAREQGMFTVFGAPNVLRGKSQSGSVKVMDAINAGVADCLCSDYSPAALLTSVFRIAEEANLGLAKTVRMVTAHPARAARMTDRGEVVTGKLADLIAVTFQGGMPQASRVWVHGREIFKSFYDGA